MAASVPAVASATGVSSYRNVKLYSHEDPDGKGKPAKLTGTLNLDAGQKSLLFVVRNTVQQTVPYRRITTMGFEMKDRVLRVEYKAEAGQPPYIDMELPSGKQEQVLRAIQDQTGIIVRLR
jgi:hypothetical protein